jgi:hypothetical protein
MSEKAVNISYFDADTITGALSLIEDNLGTQAPSVLNLPRIRIPSGGGLALRIDTPAGEESVKEATGVIISWRRARVYYQMPAGRGGKKPPDCSSTDGLTGIGDPGGECRNCRHARFGSAVGPSGAPTAGQACKEVRQLLILLPGKVLPHLLNVPPTSVKAFTQYTMTLLSAQVAYWAATTRIIVEKATNESGVEYAKIVFRLERQLEPGETAALRPYHERMKEALVSSLADGTPYEVEDEPRTERQHRPLLSGSSDDEVPF